MDETKNTGSKTKINVKALAQYVDDVVFKESQTLVQLVNIVSQSIHIGLKGIVSSSNLSSDEMELLAMKIPAECLRIQASLNQYSSRNIFKDLVTEAQVTEVISSMTGTKGNAEERKRMAELLVLDERAINAANKAIVRGLQGYIDRADKVYEGIKKVLDYRAREGWFDRKNTGA